MPRHLSRIAVGLAVLTIGSAPTFLNAQDFQVDRDGGRSYGVKDYWCKLIYPTAAGDIQVSVVVGLDGNRGDLRTYWKSAPQNALQLQWDAGYEGSPSLSGPLIYRFPNGYVQVIYNLEKETSKKIDVDIEVDDVGLKLHSLENEEAQKRRYISSYISPDKLIGYSGVYKKLRYVAQEHASFGTKKWLFSGALDVSPLEVVIQEMPKAVAQLELMRAEYKTRCEYREYKHYEPAGSYF